MSYVLCWDVDGTLLTTGRAGLFAYKAAVREVCGVDVDLSNLQTAGLTDAEVAARVLEHAGVQPTADLVDAVLRAYERHLPDRLHWRRGSVLPGVQQILEALAGRADVISLLLTGNTPEGARAKLTHYGLADYFPSGAFCESPGAREAIARKAHALARERIGGEPDLERFYVIGDSPADIRCGKAIGARTVAVASGVHPLAELQLAEPWLVLEQLPPPPEFERLLGLPSSITAGG
jgi:phosphoglycolate phosphatase-like HAD superfamily hydrolase